MNLSAVDFRGMYMAQLNRTLKHNIVTDLAARLSIPYWHAEALLESYTITLCGDKQSNSKMT